MFEQYNKIYNEITYLKYKVKARDIDLICVIEKSDSWLKKDYSWHVYLDQRNVFSNRYDVEFYHEKAYSLEKCIDYLETFINKNFKVD